MLSFRWRLTMSGMTATMQERWQGGHHINVNRQWKEGEPSTPDTIFDVLSFTFTFPLSILSVAVLGQSSYSRPQHFSCLQVPDREETNRMLKWKWNQVVLWNFIHSHRTKVGLVLIFAIWDKSVVFNVNEYFNYGATALNRWCIHQHGLVRHNKS